MALAKKWKVAPRISQEIVRQFPEWDYITLQLLYNRGIKDKKEIEGFLMPQYEDLHDPFLFKGMKKAVDIVKKSLKERERIVVYGDYDADGVTSTVLLATVIKKLGGRVSIYIPDREKEGYGLNQKAIAYLLKKKPGLVITVDCGISNREEVETLKKAGVKVIVTDHHLPPKEVPQCPIINPKWDKNYPFYDLAGVGVAFKLAQALLRKIETKGSREALEKWLLDLVAVGTIADCVPLVGENRILVKYGLIVLNKSSRPGLREVVKSASLSLGELTAYDVAFRLAPRINSAGRMDHANSAFKLLVSSGEKASLLASQLNQANNERQKITDKVFQNIVKRLGEDPAEKIIFSVEKDCPVGILGLVAGKVADFYYRPAFVFTEKEGEVVGSGRSVPGFNITASLQSAANILTHFGGHPGACGLSFPKENLKQVQEKINAFGEKKLSKKLLEPVLKVDAEISFKDINWGLWEDLKKFTPFGEGNSQPRFLTRGVKVFSSREVGQNGGHLKIFAGEEKESGICSRDCIGFGLGEKWGKKIKAGDVIDLVYEVEENRWNGNRELQLRVIDLRLSN